MSDKIIKPSKSTNLGKNRQRVMHTNDWANPDFSEGNGNKLFPGQVGFSTNNSLDGQTVTHMRVGPATTLNNGIYPATVFANSMKVVPEANTITGSMLSNYSANNPGINAAKLGNDLIGKSEETSNGIKVSVTQNTSTRKFEVGVAADPVTNSSNVNVSVSDSLKHYLLLANPSPGASGYQSPRLSSSSIYAEGSKLYATNFEGLASKATGDAGGSTITSSYASSLALSGTSLLLKSKDSTTLSNITQDNLRTAIGVLPVANGGTGSNLSGTGSPAGALYRISAGAEFSVGAVPLSCGGTGVNSTSLTAVNRTFLARKSTNAGGSTGGSVGFRGLELGDIPSSSTSNRILRVGTNNTDPDWSQVNLSTDVAGTLPVVRGGTGVANFRAYGLICGGSGTAGSNSSSSLRYVDTSVPNSILVSKGTTSVPEWSLSPTGLTSVSATTFYATSDRRLKENISKYNYNKSILDLEVKQYNWKDTKKKSFGMIAQEVKELFPEIVSDEKDGSLSIEEGKLTYLLLLEVKKLRKELGLNG